MVIAYLIDYQYVVMFQLVDNSEIFFLPLITAKCQLFDPLTEINIFFTSGLRFTFPSFSPTFVMSIGHVPRCFCWFHSAKIRGIFFVRLYSLC